MNVISSIPSLYNFEREGISHDSLMKRYAILYEQIIFNRHGAPIGGSAIDLGRNLPEFMSVMLITDGSLKERRVLGGNKKFQKLFVDCWDVVSDVEKFESMRSSIISEEDSSRISDFIFPEIRRINNLSADSYDFDFQKVKELSGDLYADIGLNLLAVKEGFNIIPSYSSIIGRALANEVKHAGGNCYDIFRDGVLIPNFDAFTWDEILELREDKYVKSFRNIVYDLMNKQEPVDVALQKRIENDLWKLVSDVKPNVRQSVLAAIGSNIPSPIIVNPIGAGMALKDISDNRKREEKYGHVFFIQKMRDL